MFIKCFKWHCCEKKCTYNVHTPDRKTVTPTSRCSESNDVLCRSKNDITIDTNLKGLETICSFILKLFHLDIIHQAFLVLIAVPVCFRARVTVFLSTVCNIFQLQRFYIIMILLQNVYKMFTLFQALCLFFKAVA